MACTTCGGNAAAVVVLISLAYLEEDDLMLVLALIGGALTLGVDALIFSQLARLGFTEARIRNVRLWHLADFAERLTDIR